MSFFTGVQYIAVNAIHASNMTTQSLQTHQEESYPILDPEPLYSAHGCAGVAWSASDPWTFASLSYDGRVAVNTVSSQVKYKILI